MLGVPRQHWQVSDNRSPPPPRRGGPGTTARRKAGLPEPAFGGGSSRAQRGRAAAEGSPEDGRNPAAAARPGQAAHGV
eukprot:1577128-Pyramimonas_sp.AAC.1